MNLPEFGLPERLNVPPFGEQQSRLGRQILLGVKVAAILFVVWLIIFGITSCMNAINDMMSLPTGGGVESPIRVEATSLESLPGQDLH
ncbi:MULTISPECIES: hypothetical protein [unclassified Brevibacterium]|uniref:hypothetical protein n=1 Tax=unclassified Brevibacterium TaxID=2614124 RepID=UPI0010813ACB|nr:hypothetical protein [Brevibacterium sp. S111]TGD09453.1 hypothetical protein EB836_14355 [Brevibacterium sp. S111]